MTKLGLPPFGTRKKPLEMNSVMEALVRARAYRQKVWMRIPVNSTTSTAAPGVYEVYPGGRVIFRKARQ